MELLVLTSKLYSGGEIRTCRSSSYSNSLARLHPLLFRVASNVDQITQVVITDSDVLSAIDSVSFGSGGFLD